MRIVNINGTDYAEHDLACPECGQPMHLKWGAAFSRLFYGCSTWAQTRCPGTHTPHPDGKPLGIPANVPTKQARMAAHSAFDKLWKGGKMSRGTAYKLLQTTMNMTSEEAHISRFTQEQCEKLLDALAEHGIKPDPHKDHRQTGFFEV